MTDSLSQKIIFSPIHLSTILIKKINLNDMTDKDIDRQIDARLAALLKAALPEARENQWFTRRVMNRLPEQSAWSRISVWQWICYLLGAAGMIVAIILSVNWMLASDFSTVSLLGVTSTSLLSITCAGVMIVPSLVRIIREA